MQSPRNVAPLALALSALALSLSCSSGTEPKLVPTTLTLEQGDAQRTRAGFPVSTPFIVRVSGDNDRGVPNITVYAEVAGGAVVQANTGNDGRATLAPVVGRAVGDQSYALTVTGLPQISGVVHAIAGPPETVAAISGDQQSDTVGRRLALPLVAVVRDTFGNPTAGVAVAWAVVGGTGQLDSLSTTTDNSGRASAHYTLGNSPRVDSISATVAKQSGTAKYLFEVHAIQHAAASIRLNAGSGQQVVAGDSFAVAPSATVLDAHGAGLAMLEVEARASRGSVTPTHVFTDSSGTVRLTSWISGAKAGVDTLTLSAGTTRLVITGVAVPGAPATLLVHHVGADTTESGTLMASTRVILADSLKNPVPDSIARGLTVSVALAPSAASLGGRTSLTLASDSASFDSLVISGGGPQVMRFTAGALPTAAANIYAKVHPTVLAFPSRVLVVDSGSASAPALTVRDSANANVSGAQLLWSSTDSTVARPDTAGRVNAVARGQSIVRVRSALSPNLRDSALVVVASPAGAVLLANVAGFTIARDSTLDLAIDVLPRGTTSIGSLTGSLRFDPSLFSYIGSAASSATGVSVEVNANDAATGVVRFAFADADGVTSRTNVLHVSLHAIAGGSGTLSLGVDQATAADATLSSITKATTAVAHPVVLP